MNWNEETIKTNENRTLILKIILISIAKQYLPYLPYIYNK